MCVCPGPLRRAAALGVLAGILVLFPSFPSPALPEDDGTIVLVDVSEAAGFGSVQGDRFSFGDYDDDGDPDLLIQGRVLLRNDTKYFGKKRAEIRFTDVTQDSGIGDGAGGGACWVDLDGDGDLDVVTTGGAVKIQYPAGRFRDAAGNWGLRLKTAMASLGVGDVDGDGRPDVLFGGGEDWNDGQPKYFPRILLKNVGGKHFEEVTEDHTLAGGRYGRAVVFADHDLDGDLDVYLGNYRLQPNELLANEDTHLVNRAKETGVEGRFSRDRATLPTGQKVGYSYGHTIAASWADLDADGDLDLWVSNLVHKFAGEYKGRYDHRGWICDDSAIYRNDGAPGWGFTDMRAESGIPLKPTGGRDTFRGDELWSHAAVADLDQDGLPEVFVTQVYKLPYSHSCLFHNRGDFRFEEISGDVGVRRFDSYGGAFADVDGDGDMDLVTNGRPTPEGPREVRLYRNDTAPGPWVAYRLRGPGGDPMPIGAQVVLACEDARLVRQVEGTMGSHAQQNESVLRFGLRERTPKAAWVRWPGGIVQALGVPKPGAVRDVAFPKGKVPTIRLDPPERGEDGVWHLRARAKATSSWAWFFDLDGDGVFETRSRDGRATVPARGPCEVRVRLWRQGKGLGREAVWRLGFAD